MSILTTSDSNLCCSHIQTKSGQDQLICCSAYSNEIRPGSVNKLIILFAGQKHCFYPMNYHNSSPEQMYDAIVCNLQHLFSKFCLIWPIFAYIIYRLKKRRQVLKWQRTKTRMTSQSISFHLLERNIPFHIDAGWIYNKSEANIRVKLIRYGKICTVLIYSHT